MGPSSMLSIDSAAHLPSVPIEWMPMAMVPAQAPSPVIGMKITARINSGTARIALNSWRIGTRTQYQGLGIGIPPYATGHGATLEYRLAQYDDICCPLGLK